jgi:riboflavin synthase
MFTGIVEDKGKVLRLEYRSYEKRLILELPVHLTDMQLGNSISINGVCLTVSEKNRQTVVLDLSPKP